jgi:hypothetical protein
MHYVLVFGCKDTFCLSERVPISEERIVQKRKKTIAKTQNRSNSPIFCPKKAVKRRKGAIFAP